MEPQILPPLTDPKPDETPTTSVSAAEGTLSGAVQPTQVPPAEASPPVEAAPQAGNKPFDPIEALKLGSLRLANIIRSKPAGGASAAGQLQDQGGAAGEGAVVARIRATAAGLSAKAKQQGSHFYQASITTAASTAEGIKRLALGEPLQALCRSECASHPCPQLVLAACTALVAGGGIQAQRIFKHNPPPELVDRLSGAAGSLSLLPPGASPHAIAALLKRFLLGLPEPLLTYRLLPQWVAAGDHPASCQSLLPQLPAANAGTLKLLMQVCSYIHAEAAQNEMDALALAEVLVPCMAWKPPAKPQSSGAPGPWQGLAKALTLNKTTGAAAAAGLAHASTDAGATAAAGAGGDGATAAQAAGAPVQQAAADEQQQQQQLDEANRVLQLDEAEMEAVVTVVEFMITNCSSVFGSSSDSSTSSASSTFSNGNTVGALP